MSSVPVELRMQELLLSCERIPSSVVFTDSTKTKVDGFRWAPSSISQSSLLLPNPENFLRSYVTREGIVMELAGYRISPRHGCCILSEFNALVEGTGEHRRISALSFENKLERWDLLHSGDREYAIPVPPTIRPTRRLMFEVIGLLVSINGQEGDLFFAKIECRLGIHTEQRESDLRWVKMIQAYSMLDSWPSSSVLMEKILLIANEMMRNMHLVMEVTPSLFKMRLAEAAVIDPPQRWCIG